MERAAGARSRAWQQSGIRPEFAQPPAFSTPPQHERGTREREICISVREEGRKLDGERGREISGVDKKKKKEFAKKSFQRSGASVRGRAETSLL